MSDAMISGDVMYDLLGSLMRMYVAKPDVYRVLEGLQMWVVEASAVSVAENRRQK